MALTSALALLVLPVAARAQDPAGGTSAPSAEAAPTVGAGDLPVVMPTHAMVRERVRIRGRATKARRKVVRVERRVPGGQWVPIANVRATKRGSWSVLWKPRTRGSYELRARIGRAAGGTNGGTSVGGLPTQVGSAGTRYVTVFSPAIATWYGPGFFGNTTACDIELTRATVGVAHRDLPCGTQVQLAYEGRTIIVPVIDRGPFANNADWDLTQAAAEQLGMTATSRIGFMPLNPAG